jgi:ABC-type antimicrobial peptide transport system permease subunit
LDRQIVGVVSDNHKDVRKKPVETIYFPYTQWDKPERLIFYVRTQGAESDLGPAIRRLVRSIDAGVPVGDFEPMTVLVRNSIYTDRLIAILSIAFGVLATLLAAVGLYGVIGSAVARRTPEIGIRVALGALPADVLRLVFREASAIVGFGIAIGIVGGVALGRFVQSQLFGLQGGDPGMLAAAVVLLTTVAVAAAFIPAWRASRIDPLSALKYE